MPFFKKSLFLIWLFHKKLFKYTLILLLSLIAIGILASALLVGTLYYANKHGQLQRWLNKALQTVQINYQKADVSWHDADPTLILSGVEIQAPAVLSQAFTLGEIKIDFSVWRSLLHWQWVTDNLSISGIQFNFRQEKDGRFQWVGLRQNLNNSSSGLSPAVMDWFLAQNSIHIADAGIGLQLLNGQNLALHLTEINWLKDFDYRFNLKGNVTQIPGSSLQADALLKPGEDPLDFAGWRANLNGSFSGKNFTPLFLNQRLYQVSWVSGGGKIIFHGNWDNRLLQSFNIYLNLNNLKLQHDVSHNIIVPQFAEAISGNVTSRAGAWKVKVNSALHTGNKNPAAFNASYDPSLALPWQVAAQNLDLKLVGQWLNFWFPAKSEPVKTWQTLQPVGMISTINIKASQKAGALTLQGQNLSLGPTPVLPKAWPQSTLGLDMSWNLGQRAATLADIKVNAFSLTNPWITLAASGTAQIPKKNALNPMLNFKGNFSGKNLEQIKDAYLPHTFMPKELTDWLEQGLVKLPSVTGHFILQGTPEQFPYADGKGLFEVALHLSDADISAWPEWPEIENITGDLLFKNQRFTIDTSKAETAGVPLENVHLEIADLRPHHIEEILITGKANPTGNQALNYLASIPLTSEKLATWLNGLNLSGDLPLNMHIVIPLEEHKPIVATGDVTLTQNDWSLTKGEAPLLTDMTGHLHFVNDEISSTDLKLTALDQNLAVSIPQSPLTNLQLFIEQFSFLGQNFPHLEIDLVSTEDKTVLTFKHALVEGTLFIAGADQAIVTHFTEFHLPVLGSATMSSPVDQNLLLGKLLSKIPALTVTVDQLYYGDTDLGQFSLNSVPIKNGVQINALNLNGKDITLVTGGRIKTKHQQDQFQVSGILNSKNYGNLLKDFDYPGIVNGGTGSIKFDLNWDGVMATPDWTTLNGSVNFNLTDGKLLKINTGIARIFGLVSLDTIFSTLSFNFNKMLSNGLSFDAVTGGYTIENGIADSGKKGIRIAGPSLSLILKGKMDIPNQTLHQTATVMPQIGTSVAIAAAFMGGPVVGVAAWFAEKILDNTILKNTGITYNVTGTFDKPVVSLFKPVAAAAS